MDDRQHERVSRWERIWVAFAGFVTLMFVMLIAYNLAVEGTHIAQRSDRGTPEQLLARPQFAEPGVRVLAPGHVQVTRVANAFSFQPADVRVPVGAQVDFYLTSRDVLHGYQVEGTNINVELVPGEVSHFRYTFDTPGTYNAICNEYCGIGHHTMLGTITVVPAAQWREEDVEAATGAPDEGADGEAVYAEACASCHQPAGRGVAGAFPPLAAHSAELVADEGRDYIPLVLLYGLEGEIIVQGRQYSGVMPAWEQLSDEQLAAVSNYIVDLDPSGLPDDHAPYAPEEFAELRGQDLTPADVRAWRNE